MKKIISCIVSFILTSSGCGFAFGQTKADSLMSTVSTGSSPQWQQQYDKKQKPFAPAPTPVAVADPVQPLIVIRYVDDSQYEKICRQISLMSWQSAHDDAFTFYASPILVFNFKGIALSGW